MRSLLFFALFFLSPLFLLHYPTLFSYVFCLPARSITTSTQWHGNSIHFSYSIYPRPIFMMLSTSIHSSHAFHLFALRVLGISFCFKFTRFHLTFSNTWKFSRHKRNKLLLFSSMIVDYYIGIQSMLHKISRVFASIPYPIFPFVSL